MNVAFVTNYSMFVNSKSEIATVKIKTAGRFQQNIEGLSVLNSNPKNYEI